MTKKEYCLQHDTIATHYGLFGAFGGLVLKGIEYGCDDYIYYECQVDGLETTYHRSKIRYGIKESTCYFMFKNRRIPLNECVRVF